MIMRKEYILFDLDGTLTDSQEGIFKSVQYALENIGIKEEDEELLKKYIGPPLIESFKAFHGLDDETALKCVGKFRERYNVTGLYENKLMDGMKECIAALHDSGRKLALATCKPENVAVQIIEHFKIDKYFDALVGSSLDDSRKYKNQVIEEAFRRLGEIDKGFTKEAAIMVGDRKDDVLGAKKAGIECIGVRLGFAEENELENAGADYIVDTAEELTKLIIGQE